MIEPIDLKICSGCTHQNHCGIPASHKHSCYNFWHADTIRWGEFQIKGELCYREKQIGEDTTELLKGKTMDVDEGTKFDDEKTRLDLIPPAAIEGVGLVLTFGAKKYAAYNWAKGIHYSRILGTIKRHLLAIEKGEDVDPESGLLHIDHVACNAAFLQTFQRYDRYKKFDDRFNYGGESC